MYKFKLFLCLAFIGSCLADDSADINAIQNTLQEKFPELNSTGVNLQEVEDVLKQKCIKEANEEAYNNVLTAKDSFTHCLQSIVDVEVLKDEIEKAKPTGDLDTVFKKYCQKTPLLKQCVSNFTDSIEPCLNVKERENKRIIINVTESLADFICFKEGDRIALFIAEGGPECLENNNEAIQECVNSTVAKYVPKETPTLANLPELVMKAEQCEDMLKLQDCIVTKLESCKEPTPSNIAESLFKFIRKVTPCGSSVSTREVKPSAQVDSKSSSATAVIIPTLIFTLTTFLLV